MFENNLRWMKCLENLSYQLNAPKWISIVQAVDTRPSTWVWGCICWKKHHMVRNWGYRMNLVAYATFEEWLLTWSWCWKYDLRHHLHLHCHQTRLTKLSLRIAETRCLMLHFPEPPFQLSIATQSLSGEWARYSIYQRRGNQLTTFVFIKE